MRHRGAEHRRFPGIKRVQLLKNWQFYPLARDWVPYGKGSIPNGARTFPPVEEDAAVARHPPQSARRGRNVEVGTKRANSLPYPTLRRKPSTGGVRWNWRNLRLAPDDPVSLVRAAAVCRGGAASSPLPGFRRRFAQRHRTAPMLGFFANIRDDNNYTFLARFVPPPASAHPARTSATTARSTPATAASSSSESPGIVRLEVWDPVTDDLHKLPDMTRLCYPTTSWNAAVVCAAHGACDHLDCHRGPFLVVLLDTGLEMHVFVYSSESGAWNRLTCGPPPSPICSVRMVSPALLGNALHFLTNTSILKYDLAAQSVSKIHLPRRFISDFIVLTTTEDGLGIRCSGEVDGIYWWRDIPKVTCTLGHWLMVTDGVEGQVLWTQNRSVALETLLNVDASSIKDGYIAFTHDVGCLFVGTDDAWFSIDVKSGQVREEDCGDGHTYGVVPYMSFYTPDVVVPVADPARNVIGVLFL
ncbi:hypothetical protein HU200_005772 [Digitaria exilis]|uniref:Uncharacterized protein n=1 Tax=Digitaria exilis TaxID=1010633 RepID=A0A835KSE6_9POAL|nr:hypothetical protein HU200_005772 [Digitaria exilis]